MTQQLTWPPALTFDRQGRCTFTEVEQDSAEEIQQGVALLCELRPGDLVWAEQLGIPDPAASIDVAQTAREIEQAINRTEPRARFEAALELSDRAGRQLRLRMIT